MEHQASPPPGSACCLKDRMHPPPPGWSELEETRRSTLLPGPSDIGGDIYLLPDVVAPFSPSPHDSFVTRRPHSASMNLFTINILRPPAPMRFLHSGIALMPVVQMQKERK